MHTPLPWARDDLLPPNGREVIARTTGYVPISAERDWGKEVSREEDEANADLIVRAVNSHPAMLEALEVLAYRLEMDGRTADGITKADAAAIARAAIAQARGEDHA